MKTLISLAVAALAAVPAAAQQGTQPDNQYWTPGYYEGHASHEKYGYPQESIIVEGDVAVVLSLNPNVNAVIAYKDYLINRRDLSAAAATNGYDADDYTIKAEGLEINGSIHGPDALIAWKNAADELDHVLSVARKNGKRSGAEELAERVSNLRRTLKTLAIEKRAEELAERIPHGCEIEPGRLYNVDVQALEAKLDKLELQVYKAKTPAGLAEASRGLDLFTASLPK